MSTSRQSPQPTPQSPLVVLGEDKLKTQLDLEERLRLTGEELLEVYKNSRQWRQVSQIAQTLTSNSDRITCIQDCLSSLNVFELPPPAPPSIQKPPPSVRQTSPQAIKEMVEDPYDEFISVRKVQVTEGVESVSNNSQCWEIQSNQYTKGERIQRTALDSSELLRRIHKGRSNVKLSSDNLESPKVLREVLTQSLQGSDEYELSLVLTFLSPKVDDFSALVGDIENPAARPIKSVLPVIGDQPESKLPDEPCPFSKDVTPISNGQENSEIEPDTIQNGNEPDTKEPGNEPDTKEPGNEPDTKEHGNEPDTIEHGNEPDNTPLTINTEDSSTVDNSTIEHETITIDTSNQDNMTHDEIEKETTTVLKPDNEKQTVEVLPNDSSNNAAGEIEPVEKKINLEELSDDLVDGLTQDPTPGKGPGTNGGNTPQPAVTHIKANIHITTASHLVIKSSDEGDPDADPPISSGTDTPTDFEGSGGVMSKSEDEPGNMTGKGSGSDQTNVGKSSFFVDSGHSTDSPIRKESPKDARRGKSHSVFYSRKSESPPPDKTDKTKLSKLKRSFKRTNKIKREVSTDAGSVSLMAPQLATNWDPTCILEELYSDCRPVVPQSSTGESSRFAGYLDKLPVNQSKPAVMKGWKHRYFRVTRGSLFYYDDDKSQKAISFVRLTDARIVLHLESLKVEINEKNGNFIFLRAENRDEAQALQRALQLESVHPTLTHRLSLSPGRATPTIILDLGSCSVRAGLVSDDSYPQLFFPNVCAFSNHTLLACGSDSLLPSTRGVAKLVYPRRHRARMDSSISIRECFTAIVEDICKRLDVKPENCNMLASISPIMPEMEQQILAEVVLETLGFQGLLVQEQTTLALYSYNCTTGISVNVGDSVSVVPIVDGYKVEGADQHLPLGGGNISEHLSKLASARDIRYFSDTEMYIIRHVKETLCFVSQDYFKDVSNCDETPYQYTRAVDLDKFQLPDHKKVIALDIALFKAPEGLFQPIVWGKDVPSIQEMVHRSIEQCPIDFKREMCRHIYLSGGTTLMTGFPERLKAELSKLMPRVEIVIHADENRHHSAYLGASILASLNSYQKSLVTPDDWITDGFDAFRKTN